MNEDVESVTEEALEKCVCLWRVIPLTSDKLKASRDIWVWEILFASNFKKNSKYYFSNEIGSKRNNVSK